jgi:hypothetical protein
MLALRYNIIYVYFVNLSITTRIESYSTPVIGSRDNNNFTTKSNTIKVQGVFGISGDYIILYEVYRDNLFRIHVLYLPITSLIILRINRK